MPLKALLFENDPLFASNTLRALAHTAWGGADIGEVVTTCDRIAAGDFDSWHDEWLRTADWVTAEADGCLKGGHEVSARDGYLRASNYYRSAHFFLHNRPDDRRVSHAARRSVDCFKKFGSLSDPAIEPVEIPYEGTTLPGYFYPGSGTGKRPILVMFGGFDSTGEELHFAGAAAAAERGYRVLTFEGPGQGQVILEQGLPFRPDWENVVGPVIDYLAQRDDVDASRIALSGLSLGGVLAPRAAAFEKRLAAVISHDGLYDFFQVYAGAMMPMTEAEINAVIEVMPLARWLFGHGMWVTGTSTPLEFLEALKPFNVADGVAESINCPTLVCDDLDPRVVGQPQQLYDHLTTTKTFLEFTAEEGADEHCQAGASRLASARILDWLDDTLDRHGE